MTAMTTTRLLTADDVWNMPEVPGKRFELVRGKLIEMPGTGGIHAHITRTIVRFLERLPNVDNLGYVYGDGLSFILARNPDTILIPDASFVANARVPPDGVPVGFWPGAPDLAVEIASSSNRPAELHAKAREYLAAGTAVVWIFWPTTRDIEVVTPDGVTCRLDPDDELVTPNFLPDGRIQVSDLFPEIPTSPETPAD